MSLTRKILYLVAGVLTLFLIFNLTLLPFVTQRYFYDFLQLFYAETRQNEMDSEFLSLIREYPKEAPLLLQKYREMDEDLGRLTTGIESYISENPKFSDGSIDAYLSENGSGDAALKDVIGLNAMSEFLRNVPFGMSFTGSEDPKRRFVMQVLATMIAANILFVIFITPFVLYYLRQLFKPIRSITDTLDSFTTGGGKQLLYSGRDEFQPLVDSLNNLRIRLDHQENIRSQFLADMTHELKTPMTAIRIYLEGIKDGVIQLNTKNIDALTGELGRLTRIVESLMHFQMFESQPTVFHMTEIKLYDIFSIVQETHSGQLSHHRQTMVYDGPKKAVVYFDHDSIVQIFHNIVANFLRYAGRGTQLRVNYIYENNNDIYIFRDNGVGVHASELPYLKEKFYQADKSKTGDVRDRGLGIGLSVVEKIVQDAEGIVDIVSEEGKGFAVKIEIPRKEKKNENSI